MQDGGREGGRERRKVKGGLEDWEVGREEVPVRNNGIFVVDHRKYARREASRLLDSVHVCARTCLCEYFPVVRTPRGSLFDAERSHSVELRENERQRARDIVQERVRGRGRGGGRKCAEMRERKLITSVMSSGLSSGLTL